MRNHVFLALSDPAPGREAEFHPWYDRYHLQDVVDLCPGFARGRRYWRADVMSGEASAKWRSLAIYDLEADDVAALHENVSANVSQFTPANGVFAPDHAAWVYTPVNSDTTPRFQTGADGERVVLLAFFDTDPSVIADVDLDATIVLKRNPNQRRGESPTWDYLVIRDVPATEAHRDAARIMARDQPSELWVYHSRGTLHVTDINVARSIAD